MPHATHSRFSGAVLRAAGLNALIALAAAILSFHALFDLGRMTGVFPGWLPLLLPVVVDVFILQSSLSLVVAAAHARADRRYHWTILTISSTVSVALNAYHALKLAHRGYVLVNGRITMSGTGRQLLDDPAVKAAYLEGGSH